MKTVSFACASLCLAASVLLLAQPFDRQQQPPTTPPQSQQPTDVATKIIGPPGLPPKLAIAGVIPLSQDAETVAAAKTIADVLYDDIAYEREYYMIGKDAGESITKPTSLDTVPLDQWKQLNADGVIVGTVKKTANGVVVQVKLIQVATGKTAFGKEYSGSIANPRQYAHTISDAIYQEQIALRGVARTKLTFSSDRDEGRAKGSVSRSLQEIYIADYDGANPRRITNTTTLNVAPSWSPDNQAIAYTTWRPSGTGGFGTFQDITISWLYRGEMKSPGNGNPDRQNYLAQWSPDGTKLAFTSNRDGNPEIYIMNKDGSGLRRITNNPGIDEAPTWSPNGNQIAWVSDRTGQPKIYVMNSDGTGQRLLVSDCYCDRPTWSSEPFNEIAFAAKNGPGYDIKVYSFQTGEAKRITDSIGSNESPAFSPNGRHLVFVSTRSGKSQIFTVDRDGNNLRQLTREGNNKYPNWSR
jgi:TolB protein